MRPPGASLETRLSQDAIEGANAVVTAHEEVTQD